VPSAVVRAAAVAVPARVRAGRADQGFCRFECDNAGAGARVIIFERCIRRCGGLAILQQPRGCSLSMAFPVSYRFRGASHFGLRSLAPIGLAAIALCGCSINLGSLSPEPSYEAPKPAPAVADAAEAQDHNMRGQALVRSGKSDEALAEFNHAIAIDPHNADALYNRGLLHQGEKQHPLAIDDFSTANGLTPQRAEPLLGRAISYLALDKAREAAADLDEAAQADPQNAQIWTTRGLAYERLGDKTKAAGSYGRAINLRPRDEAARSGFARVGGKPGQSYEPF